MPYRVENIVRKGEIADHKGELNKKFQDSFNKTLSQQSIHDRFYISGSIVIVALLGVVHHGDVSGTLWQEYGLYIHVYRILYEGVFPVGCIYFEILWKI